MSPYKRRGPSLGKPDPHQDATEAAKLLNVSTQDSHAYDRNRRLFAGLVSYVANGRDRTPLDRLITASGHGRELVENGADRTTVAAALTVAGEAPGLFRRQLEDALRAALQGRGPR